MLVFKSPENKNHADKNNYKIKKKFQINLIKFWPKIALNYFFEKNVVLYEIYRKKLKVTNTYVH